MTAISAGVATASVAVPRLARPVRLAPRSRLSLAQAPAGLRAAVARTLGAPAARDGWSQQAKLTTAGLAEFDNFGEAVAISGTTAVIGATGTNAGKGAAYVFRRTGKTWSQQAELTAANGAGGDRFGGAVAISGNTAVIGASFKDDFRGAAYVFRRTGKTWSQQAELTAANGAGGDVFGDAVAISGTTAVIGAYGKDDFTGAAYVFARRGKTWSQQAELTTAGLAERDSFAEAVAISGTTAVIGAPGMAEPGMEAGKGAAYVFRRTGRAWSQQAKLTAANGARGDGFGIAMAISGKTALVGAPGDNDAMGAAYVFVRTGGAWSQQAELTAADGAPGDQFGGFEGVAISGKTALVSARERDASTGAAYVLVRRGRTWSQQAEFTASDAAEDDAFGGSVAISGKTALAGAPFKDDFTGAAYVFVRSGRSGHSSRR